MRDKQPEKERPWHLLRSTASPSITQRAHTTKHVIYTIVLFGITLWISRFIFLFLHFACRRESSKLHVHEIYYRHQQEKNLHIEAEQ